MRDFTGVMFLVGLIVVAAALFVGVTSYLRQRQEKEESKPESIARERERAATVRKMVEARTHLHLSTGEVVEKCRYCDARATFRNYRFLRDTGFFDLVRRSFGAPAKIRASRDPWGALVACDAHDALVFEEFRLEMGEYEVERARLESDHETRRARFQTDGVHERVLARIEKHQRDVVSNRRRRADRSSKVVPLHKVGQ